LDQSADSLTAELKRRYLTAELRAPRTSGLYFIRRLDDLHGFSDALRCVERIFSRLKLSAGG
jgi:hypothetical protein